MTIPYEIRVGKNAKDNWKIIDEAEGDDLWFHIKDRPSAHVILRYPSMRREMCIGDYEEFHIQECCKLLTKKRKDIIIVTLVRNLVKKGPVGTVELINPEESLELLVQS